MSRCDHCDSPISESQWHPKRAGVRGHDRDGISQHRPHCTKCGMVRNISSDTAKGLGYYTNILALIRERVNIQSKRTGSIVARFTTSQMRMIIKELEADEEFEDRYIKDRRQQKERFIEAVRKYRPYLKPEFIEGFF